MGSAVVMERGAAAFLKGCTLSSYNPEEGDQCLGLVAKSNTQLAMYDCRVERAGWGVYAGTDAGVLAKHNAFGITHVFGDDYVGQKVQPWRESWAHQAP